MAFYRGTANNSQTLLTALLNGCTANGWTLDGNILSKNGCFIQVSDNGNLLIAGGTGKSALGLTGTVLPNSSCPVSFAGIDTPINYPMTYYLHVLDMEVYMIVNYNVDFWSYIGFGQSPKGISATGNWFSGTGNGSASLPSNLISNNGSDGTIQAMMFPHQASTGFNGSSYIQVFNSFIHHGLDDNQWSCAGTSVGSSSGGITTSGASRAMGSLVCRPLLARSPNTWNGEAILLPISPAIYRPDNRRYLVGELKHAFYTRLDNYEPAQIITIGSDKYRIYPWLKKNTQDRDAYNSKTHSGTFGFAVRYDGD